jgi:hypothetical protein
MRTDHPTTGTRVDHGYIGHRWSADGRRGDLGDREALRDEGGILNRTAKRLHVSRMTLWRRIRREPLTTYIAINVTSLSEVRDGRLREPGTLAAAPAPRGNDVCLRKLTSPQIICRCFPRRRAVCNPVGPSPGNRYCRLRATWTLSISWSTQVGYQLWTSPLTAGDPRTGCRTPSSACVRALQAGGGRPAVYYACLGSVAFAAKRRIDGGNSVSESRTN